MHSTTMLGHALTPAEVTSARMLDALIAFRTHTGLRMDGSGDGGDGGQGGDGGGSGGDGGAGDGGKGGAGSGAPANATDAQGRDLGYPKDTPVAEMTADQKAAYGKAKDEERKAATREWKSVTGDRTPAQLKAELDELETLRKEKLSPSEKAIEDAKQAARNEVLPQLAETAFRVAIGDRKTEAEVDEFIADLNLSRFIKDGKVDTAKVIDRVQQYAPAKGSNDGGGHGRDFGQGNRGNGQNGKSGVAAGADMFKTRHPSSTSS
jgi:hypothetical protein